MNYKIISSFTLANKYPEIFKIVSENQPLTENNIPLILLKCEQYAKENNLTYLYPMGITPVYLIFKVKAKTGRKRAS